MTCPCGVGTDLESCCGTILDGSRPAPTPEALMRARYAAYATGQIEFIATSHIPTHRHEVDLDSSRQWSRGADWQGVEIHGTEGGGDDDQEGTVEFTARYRVNEQDIEHREIATFQRHDGAWFFVDGDSPKQEPFRREEAKVGPNAPCPCASGKKFKKCCGKK